MYKIGKLRIFFSERQLRIFAGFTLVELVIVIGIIGIVSAILSGSYIGSQKQARDAQRKNDLETIKQGLEFYKSTVNPPVYPGIITSLDPGDTETNIRPILAGVYIPADNSPTDPNYDKGYYYYYQVLGNQQYVLCAYLEKKSAGDPDCPETNISCGSRDCNYGVTQP